MKDKLSRRDFLKTAGFAIGSVVAGSALKDIVMAHNPEGNFAGYRVRDVNIGTPEKIAFVKADTNLQKDLYEKIYDNTVWWLSRQVFGTLPQYFLNEHVVDVRSLELSGSSGKVVMPYIMVSGKENVGKVLRYSIWGIDKSGAGIHVPSVEDLEPDAHFRPIAISRVHEPDKQNDVLGVVVADRFEDHLRLVSGQGWVFNSPFNDFKPGKDIFIDVASGNAEPLLSAGV